MWLVKRRVLLFLSAKVVDCLECLLGVTGVGNSFTKTKNGTTVLKGYYYDQNKINRRTYTFY